MKTHLRLFSDLLVLSIIVLSCSKDDHVKSTPPPPILNPPPKDKKEYFWGQTWDTTSRGYVININTARLTQAEINKGINVGIAVYSDWDPFVTMPFNYYYDGQTDTIRLSYIAVPGQLQIIAKTSLEIKYPSDVLIEYK